MHLSIRLNALILLFFVFLSAASAAGNLTNLAARGYITATKPMYGGFMVENGAVAVVIVANGPSLAYNHGIPDALSDPGLQVFDSAGKPLFDNDNWGGATDTAGIAEMFGDTPPHALESGLYLELQPGYYTFRVSGVNAAEGEAVLNIYLQADSAGILSNLAARGYITAAKPMYGGFMLSGGAASVALVGNGPALYRHGVTDALADPLLDVFDQAATPISSNDNWRDSQQAARLAADFGAALADDTEPGVFLDLQPGYYTFRLSGVNASQGEAVLNIYRADEDALTAHSFTLQASDASVKSAGRSAYFLTISIMREKSNGVSRTITKAGLPKPESHTAPAWKNPACTRFL